MSSLRTPREFLEAQGRRGYILSPCPPETTNGPEPSGTIGRSTFFIYPETTEHDWRRDDCYELGKDGVPDTFECSRCRGAISDKVYMGFQIPGPLILCMACASAQFDES